MNIKFSPIESNPDLKEVDPKYFKDDKLNMEALIADGWTYQDYPQMLSRYWDYVLKAHGKENVDYIKLSEADYGNGFKRGQLMLGPNARNNMVEYRKSHPIPD